MIFIDANIFIERWTNPEAKKLIDNLNREEHFTSVLVLAEVYHKLRMKNVKSAMEYIKAILGSITVFDFSQQDLFNAIKNQLDIHINDKIHIETMKRNNINTILSFDLDFDKEKTITRITIP